MYRLSTLPFRAFFAGFLCLTLMNCSSTSMKQSINHKQPVERVIDRIVILADTSSSISQNGVLLEERDILNAFVQLLPEGNYEAGMSSFDTVPRTLVSTKKFNRKTLAAKLQEIITKGGGTEIDRSLNETEEDLEGLTDRTAIVIFSDGQFSDSSAAIFACQDLVNAYQGNLCIHTVLLGGEAKGAGMLKRLSDMSDCGSFRFANSLNSQKAQHAFIDEVFFGIKPKMEMKMASAENADADGDGVSDDKDQCPDTPKGAKVDANGCWDLPVILFDYNKSDVRDTYSEAIQAIAKVLKDNPDVEMKINGHTDSVGSERFNNTLSMNRALMVKAALFAAGAPEAQLSTQGFAFKQPVKPNDSDENRQANRRVELIPNKR